jgi:hypothetical protein
MNRKTVGRPESASRAKVGIGVLFVCWLLPVIPSCQDIRTRDALPAFLQTDSTTSIQEGEITLRDGEETIVPYLKPFATPPRLVIVELRQSAFLKKPFSKEDFQFVIEEPNYFKIRSLHDEHACGSWAVVKWRAEGVLAAVPSASDPSGRGGLFPSAKTPQEKIIERTKQLGGTTEFVPPLPTGTLVGLDLHATRTTDTDLALLDGLTGIRSLNLYDTKVTDAGLKHLGGLTDLQTLYLNDTGVSDAGLQSLRGLTSLTVLGLTNTRVTDEGLTYLTGRSHLREVSLGGTKITDQGLAQLKGLKSLKLVILTHTSVTPAGVQDLKKALPGAQIVE